MPGSSSTPRTRTRSRPRCTASSPTRRCRPSWSRPASSRLREFDIAKSRRKLLDALEPVVVRDDAGVIIHQFVPTLEPGAVGAHTLAVRDVLRAAGHTSEIFASEIDAALVRPRRATCSATRAARADVIVYQMAIGSVVADAVLARDEPIVVNHHNLTPMRYIAGWQPVAAHGVTWGRGQLRELGRARRARRRRLELQRSTTSSRRDSPAPPSCRSCSISRRSTSSPRPRPPRTDAVTWLFVGRLAPNKAQHDIVKAFAAYRRFHNADAQLHLVGGGREDGYGRTLRALHPRARSRRRGDAHRRRSARRARRVLPRPPTCSSCAASTRASACRCSRRCTTASRSSRSRPPPSPRRSATAGLLLDVKDPCTIAAAVDHVVGDPALRAQLVDAGARRVPRLRHRAHRARVRRRGHVRRARVGDAVVKLAVVTPRYGIEVPGGAETAARLLATHLAAPARLHRRGAHHVRARRRDLGRSLPRAATPRSTASRVRRFPVTGTRSADFDARTDLVVRRGRRVTDAEQREWLDKQGPVAPGLIDAIAQSDADVVRVPSVPLPPDRRGPPARRDPRDPAPRRARRAGAAAPALPRGVRRGRRARLLE